MPRHMLICVKDKEYAKRLAEYIAGQREYQFRVRYCSDIETARGLARYARPDYLLIDDAFSPEERASVSAMRRFLLSEEACAPVREEETAVFKYRSATEIIQAVTDSSLDDTGILNPAGKGERASIIGFYSPVKRTGQTSLALAIGSRLSRGDGTLYLNLCAHADGEYADGEAGSTLDQYLYFLEQEAPNNSLRLKSMTAQRGEMDYLRPVALRDDLESVSEETWLRMIEGLKKEAPYGYVLLDMGDSVRGLRTILKQCSLVYMPVSDDEHGRAKAAAFSRELKTVKEAELIRKIRKVTMNRDMSVIADSCVRAIQSEGEGVEPARRDQSASA